MERRTWASILALIALTWGLTGAVSSAWSCDDAFISFRYARHLVEGQGLVFNPGERVEGYTNFLWTLLVALGMLPGWKATLWANLLGIASYLGSIFLLVTFHHRLRSSVAVNRFAFPLAALGAALHPDWNIYASSGLETSFYTFLLLAAYLILTGNGLTNRRAAAAGIVLGLAFLTRPDGFLLALTAGFFVLWRAPARIRAGALYGVGFLSLAVPFLAWRIWYYHDLFPNTYYAKSAYLAWYSQGWQYVSLYFSRYWPLLFSVPAVAYAGWRRWGLGDGTNVEFRARVGLAALWAFSYTFYILRLGGDFMFARMLIPVTPFFLILLELGLFGVLWKVAFHPALLAGLLCLGILFTPTPVTGEEWFHGIANEWMFYSPQRVQAFNHKADVLGRFFKGLPIRLAYLGADARVAYRARIPVVIDCYGLTDPFIARLPLPKRGRVGHEKLPPVSYLVSERRAHFIFNSEVLNLLPVGQYIPLRKIELEDIEGLILHWDADLMAQLKRRGARFGDFPSELDRYLEQAGDLPSAQVRQDFLKFKHFYFDWTQDPAREAAFRRLSS
ncbi:MAG: hypothetical protein ACE5JX_11970 [Acidobacteriota bacterium]